ncbi:hypothetical protein NEHOM01_1053 [Nematocida homosporus]|uniref:uncharacterized protein n=1 Tax=Nematocida homosporus TaxID=1912981 RepID=UPI00221ED626|nr:uncharacterized protein NEHOM01_1053 [Nematocida homosporus]KAI5185776.1 hypothetical protein NEHOM01_1053 [Nematocida homosporus]
MNLLNSATSLSKPSFLYNHTEGLFKSLFLQILFLSFSILIYLKTAIILFWIALVYFGANSCFLLVMIFINLSTDSKRRAVKPPIPPKTKKPLESKFYPTGEISNPTEEPSKNKFNLQLSFRKRNKKISPPIQQIIKKYSEYKSTFYLTKELEKQFKTWVHVNIVIPAAKEGSNVSSTTGWVAKPLTKQEMDDLKLMANNGFICYDKENELHGRALFKTLYNYFNTIMPGGGSYYANPMDEFVFEDIHNTKFSAFGLLVEDTESLLERKKMFNVYFMNGQTFYDTEGDTILSFLLLLIHANITTGRYLGSLSLRNIDFLPCPKI